MSDRPTVFLVDDDASIRRTLPQAIASPDYRVDVFSSADAFLSSYDGQAPGCILTDLRMPRMTGLDLQEELIRRRSAMPIIFLTGYGSVETATKAMKSGAIYFFEKPIDPPLLVDRIREALELNQRQRQQTAQQLEIDERLSRLTRRQREVLDLVVQGLTSKQIADQLGRSIKTIEVHRSQILNRMNAQGVTELMRMVLAPDHAGTPANGQEACTGA